MICTPREPGFCYQVNVASTLLQSTELYWLRETQNNIYIYDWVYVDPKSNLAPIWKRVLTTNFETNKLQMKTWCLFNCIHHDTQRNAWWLPMFRPHICLYKRTRKKLYSPADQGMTRLPFSLVIIQKQIQDYSCILHMLGQTAIKRHWSGLSTEMKQLFQAVMETSHRPLGPMQTARACRKCRQEEKGKTASRILTYTPTCFYSWVCDIIPHFH